MVAISAIGVEEGEQLQRAEVLELDSYGMSLGFAHYCFCQIEFYECCRFLLCEMEDPCEDQIR